MRIVLDGLRDEDSITELCWRGGLGQSSHHVWSKKFLEADNLRLAGDTACTATTDEVMNLRCECSCCWRWGVDTDMQRAVDSACVAINDGLRNRENMRPVEGVVTD